MKTSRDELVKRLRDHEARVRASIGHVMKPDDVTDYGLAADMIDSLAAALKGLSDMYSFSWDLVDGGLMMMPERGVPKFEAAHKAALLALGVEVYDGE